jgi:K+-sensing histidine kinase KdpD
MDDRLKDLEASLAKLAHDLRTPLAVVHTTTNMLLNPKYQLTPEQVRDQHERIRRNVEILNRLVGELAELAHAGAGSGADPLANVEQP